MIKKNESVMYLGPTIRGVVRSGAVFSDGIPERLERLAGKKAFVKSLIVPLSRVVEAKKAINDEGTAEAVSYDKIADLTIEEIEDILKGE